MPALTRRSIISLVSAAVVASLAPVAVGVVAAQVRKCYRMTCSTVNGETLCFEKEVPCRNEA